MANLFYLFLFTLPFQTRILAKNWNGGEFSEWNSAFFYLSDAALSAVLLFWVIAAFFPFFNMYSPKRALLECGRKIISDFSDRKAILAPLVGFFVFSALSLLNSGNPALSFYHLLKLGEFILLFVFVSHNFGALDFKKVLLVLIAAGIFQGAIADWQWHAQSDAGLKILGESPLGADVVGVAKIDLPDGSKLIRPYGTFPHPNVLAAFLLLCLFSFYYLVLDYSKKFKSIVNCQLSIVYCVAGVVFLFLFYVLFLTFSKAAIAVFLLASAVFFAARRRSNINVVLLGVLFAAASVFFFSVFSEEIASAVPSSPAAQTISLRLDYASAAWKMFKEFPLFGAGFGNFVWRLPAYLPPEIAAAGSWIFQPVHNIYLLVAAETGIFGLLFFAYFLFQTAKKGLENLKQNGNFLPFFVLFSAFLFLGAIDHYFLTLQQGGLIFWLSAAFLLSVPRVPESTESAKS